MTGMECFQHLLDKVDLAAVKINENSNEFEKIRQESLSLSETRANLTEANEDLKARIDRLTSERDELFNRVDLLIEQFNDFPEASSASRQSARR